MPNLDLKKQLASLYELQQFDLKMLSLHEQRQSVPLKIAKLEESFQIHEQALEVKKGALAQVEKELRSKNAELEGQQEHQQKYQTQLREVKTNREYQALDKEISFLEEKESEIEDTILGIMLQIDQCQEELQQQQKIFDAEKDKNRVQKAEYEQEAEDLVAAVAAHQEERKRFSPKIGKDLMNGYQAGGKHNTTAFVSIVSDNACGSCRIAIPPQTLKEARKYERIVLCASCRRILYPLSSDPAEETRS